MNRSETLEKASKYIYEDIIFLSKMRTGRRKEKFFQTTYIEGLVSDAIEDVLKESEIKYTKKNRAAFISPTALKQIEENDSLKDIVNEHIVCKNIYFNEIKRLLSLNQLTEEKIFKILDKYYFTAAVTSSEDKILDSKGLRRRMVSEGEWNKEDIFTRYSLSEIELIKNPYFIFKS